MDGTRMVCTTLSLPFIPRKATCTSGARYVTPPIEMTLVAIKTGEAGATSGTLGLLNSVKRIWVGLWILCS